MTLANYRLILIASEAVFKVLSINLNSIILVQFSRCGSPQLV